MKNDSLSAHLKYNHGDLIFLWKYSGPKKNKDIIPNTERSDIVAVKTLKLILGSAL